MKVTPLALPGALLIEPDVFTDKRGLFFEIYHREKFKEIGITTEFMQDNLSRSWKNVIRGLHFQLAPYAQDKLVRCVSGTIFDVAVDIDPSSPTYTQHVSVELSDENHHMLFIPGMYAHGFCALTDATVEYKVGSIYAPEHARGARYDDPKLNIPWPCKNPIVSEQDKKWPLLYS